MLNLFGVPFLTSVRAAKPDKKTGSRITSIHGFILKSMPVTKCDISQR